MIKKLLLFFLVVLMAGPVLESKPRRFSGRVTCAGKAVSGVSVTDGRSVVTTDINGRYRIDSDDEVEFVYVSVPSGYVVPSRNHSSCFYRCVSSCDGSVARFVDFELKRDSLDQDKHMFMYWADIQVYDEGELSYVKKAAKDAAELVRSYGDMPAFIISGGDMIAEWTHTPSLFMPVADAVAESGLSMYNVLGNHDIETDARSNDGCRKVFKSLFGPTYYSFNRGKIHYVVLDNVFFLARGYQYVGYIEERQLRWLEQDLKYVPEGSTVVVSMHIPSFSREARRQDWGKEELNKITCNRSALYEILKPYNVHLCTAHEHYGENYVLSDGLFEHVHPPLSGLFWQSLLSCDGIPWGYMVYEVDGSDIRWYYKAVGKERNSQFSVYPVGTDPMRPESVVVNVWNYDSGWKVCWYEDGIYKGEMVRYRGWDRAVCEDVELRREKEFRWKYIGAGETEHLFYAVPSNPAATVRIEVTDRFGVVYSATTEAEAASGQCQTLSERQVR